MATTDGKNAYVNIMELPQIGDIDAGDFLVVETSAGTSIINFENFLISPQNITFNETIVTNTSNINTLSAEVDSINAELTTTLASITAAAAAADNGTYAVFALTGYDANGIKLLKSSNISSATFNDSLSCIQFNFERNFESNLYGYTTGSTVSSFVSVKSISDLNTNYINTYVTNASGGFTTAPRCTINIVGGTII